MSLFPMIFKQLRRRRSFALTEVLIAISLFLIFSPFLFDFMNSTAKRYQQLNYNMIAHNMSEEALCDYVAKFVLAPPSFDSLEKDESLDETAGPFTIEKRRSNTESYENVALVQFDVAILHKENILSSKSVKLCVQK